MLLLKFVLTMLACQQFTVSVAPAVPKFTVSVVEPVSESPVIDTRPEIMVSCAPFHCPPCNRLNADIDAGLLEGFRVTKTGDFPLLISYPAIRFMKGGELLQINGWDRSWITWLSENVDGGAKQAAKPVVKVQVQQQQSVELPERWAVWQGRTYDMESFVGCSARNCNMCANLTSKQQRYRALKAARSGYQPTSLDADIPDHQQPTPADMIDRMLSLMDLTSDDVHEDAGCGDGRILIASVRQSGCRGVGIEIDPDKAEEARQNVKAAGLSDRIEIVTGDVLDFDSAAYGVTAITAYLYPELLEQLAQKFLEPGIRVVVAPFHQVPGLPMTEQDSIFVYRND